MFCNFHQIQFISKAHARDRKRLSVPRWGDPLAAHIFSACIRYFFTSALLSRMLKADRMSLSALRTSCGMCSRYASISDAEGHSLSKWSEKSAQSPPLLSTWYSIQNGQSKAKEDFDACSQVGLKYARRYKGSDKYLKNQKYQMSRAYLHSKTCPRHEAPTATVTSL